MTNKEIIEHYNALCSVKEREKEYYEKNGSQLLGGRVKILYAIGKNVAELLEKLKPYETAEKELIGEYRDLEKERAVYEEAMKQYAEQEGVRKKLPVPKRTEIYKKGKNKEELIKKIKELQDIEVEDVHIQKIDMMDLDGLALSSAEMDAFMFMLKEPEE